LGRLDGTVSEEKVDHPTFLGSGRRAINGDF